MTITVDTDIFKDQFREVGAMLESESGKGGKSFNVMLSVSVKGCKADIVFMIRPKKGKAAAKRVARL